MFFLGRQLVSRTFRMRTRPWQWKFERLYGVAGVAFEACFFVRLACFSLLRPIMVATQNTV
jgi:hypothetical protein